MLPTVARATDGIPDDALAGLRVVVVEDDDEQRLLMVEDLRARGVACDGLASAEALYRHLATHACDIVVLDVGLPGEDGFSVAAYLRQNAAGTPVPGIVMLTGRGSPRDISRGLGDGADLYLVKPFDPDVLAAGLYSLRRRLSPSAAESARAGWLLLAEGWSLCAPNGQSLALTEQERAFMRRLFASPAVPVGRDTLIAALTDEPWDFDPHRLEVLVHRLRTRVKDALGLPLPVRAVRGAGYLLVDDAG